MEKSNKKISLWEKAKRNIAHSFNLETKAEINERFEKLKQEEKQRQQMLEHHQHLRSLLVEYADEIEEWNGQRENMRLEREAERKRQEAIQLYKDNRKRQASIIYGEQQEEQDDNTEE